MKAFYLTTGIVTGLLLIFTLICGLWIKANQVTDKGSLLFHMTIGISSVVFGIISIILLFIQVFKH